MNELPQKKWFTPQEVAAYFSITDETVRNWLNDGTLDGIKIKGTTRISRESIIQAENSPFAFEGEI